MRRLILFIAAWLILAPAGSAFAQGVQTGTIRGMVTDQQDLAVPGVSVTATSPALQGPRSTTTDAQGLYVIRALPPGEYQVRFELSGFGTVNRTSTVPLGLVVVNDVSMRPAGVAETVQVTGDLPAPIATPVVGINFKQRRDRQPGDAADDSRHRAALARRQREFAEREPAGHQRRVRVRQRVHGQRRRRQRQPVRDTAESLHRGRDRGDAGADVRHLGGIRPVHRRRGQRDHQERRQQFFGQRPDQFPEQRSGRPRRRSRNASTRMSSPAPTPSNHLDKLSKTYEGTFGGPLVRDRLWFFLSGRHQFTESQSTLQQTGIVVPTTDSNKRGEIKITGTVVNNHTLQGAFLNDPRKRTNNSGLQSFIIDPHSEVDRENPNWYSYINYRGVLGTNGLAEAQYSERRFQFKGDGGTSTDLARFAVSRHLPARASTTPRTSMRPIRRMRNNRQFTGKHHELLERRRPARNQVRLRVLPQPADRRQLAVADRLRVRRGLPDRRRRHARARFHRPSDSGLRDRRIVHRVLARRRGARR